MLRKQLQPLVWLLCIFFCTGTLHAQPLSLRDAVQKALTNYGTVKAKSNYVQASEAGVKQVNREYLPDLNISLQHDYGTVNGNTGPLFGYRGGAVASSGPPAAKQNWNAAFGALYLANINWDFFAFGRTKDKIKVAEAVLARDKDDLTQEQFQQQVKVAAAYLNLLAAQRLTISWQKNLERAVTIQKVVVTRAKNGLNAGVDSSLANAEVSNATIALTRAKDVEQEQANQLAVLMGVPPQEFVLDTLFIARIPEAFFDSASTNPNAHPLLAFYKKRIELSDAQASYFRKFNYPTFSLFGVFQGRGSGFAYDYGLASDHYTTSYLKGIDPVRQNYLVGVGMFWNLTTPLRVKQQVTSQQFISKGLQNEYELVDQQLKAQLALSENKIANALANYREVPVQLKAAGEAYLQKTVLYQNGLTNMVDVTQALYTLNRAETDRDIAYSNVWQALLLKAAASGDFGLFIKEF